MTVTVYDGEGEQGHGVSLDDISPAGFTLEGLSRVKQLRDRQFSTFSGSPPT